MENTKPQYPRKESPAVLKSYPALKRGRQELKVRAIQYSKSGPLLDIREFLSTPQETRFTKKGITADVNQVRLLKQISIDFLEEFDPPPPTSS